LLPGSAVPSLFCAQSDCNPRHHERIVATAMAESESGDGVLRWRSYKKVEA
jgi:hypothetical protein